MSTLPLPIAAFVAGLVSFLSPCVLPLVPGYVSLISGAGVEELKSQEAQLLRKVMLNSVGFILGVAFAVGSTPCVGPILAVILGFAAAQDSVLKGIILLGVYSLGLAVPFLLTSLGIERFLKFYGRFRAHMHALEVASGALLIALGILLVLGRFTIISNYLSFLNRFAL